MRRFLPAAVIALALAFYVGSSLPAQTVPPNISTDKGTYLTGETVSVGGGGFSADEVITLQLAKADGSTSDPVTLTADGAGVVALTFALPDHGAGNEFTLSASASIVGALPAMKFNRIATVATDKYDYNPGAMATITGAGFKPGENITVQVVHANGMNDGNGHDPFPVVADSNGQFSTPWFVDPDDSEGSIFRLTAVGADSQLVAHSTFTDLLTTIVDDAGADDEPGQKDLNYLQIDTAPAVPDLGINWGWDSTTTNGNNTRDAGALFDTDSDGFANYSLYVTVASNGTFTTQLFACTADNRTDRCAGATLVPSFSSTVTVGNATSDPFGNPGPNFDGDHVTGNTCTTNPACYTVDTVATATIKLADFGGSTAKLLNVCSYPSGQPNSDPSDCVVAPNSGFLKIVKVSTPDEDTPFKFDLGAGQTSQSGDNTWTINGSGDTGLISFAAGNAYDLTEAIPAGWKLTGVSCAIQTSPATPTGAPADTDPPVLGAASAGVTDFEIRAGLETICTFNDAKQSGSIRVEKVTQGGTSTFEFTPTGFNGGSSFQLTTNAPGTAVGQTFGNLAPGPYSVSEVENVSDGWTLTGSTCTSQGGTEAGDPSSIVLEDGETVTCTFTNEPDLEETHGRIIVDKVTNPSGSDQSFSFDAGGGSYADFSLTDAATPNDQQLLAGQYSVSETLPAGWDLTSTSCVSSIDDTESAAGIELDAGETVTCTFTNGRTPSLTLVKTVVSDNGGTAAASAWTLSAAGPTPISGAGGASSGPTFQPGSYTLSETGTVAGYTNGTTYSCVVNGGAPVVSNSVTLAYGDTATCTITNDDQAPSLTLVKNVVSNNGGTAAASAWTLSAAGPTPISGAGGASSGATFSAGTYTLSESGTVAGYTNGTTYSCVVNGAAPVGTNSVTLANGDSATCTITNDDQAPSLTLVKNVVSNNGGTAAASAWTLSAAGPTPISGAGGASSGATFSAGTYTLSESGTVAGYTNGTTYSCVVNGAAAVSTNSVTLANGDSATCTITNDDQAPSLTLVKNVVSNNGGTAAASAWTLSAAGPTPISGAGGASSGATFSAGTYTLSESGTVAGYTNGTTYSCVVNGAAPVGTNSVILANGDSATCTITNDDQAPSLTLVKNVVSNNGGTAAASAWTLSAAGPTPISGAGGASSGATFSAGTYTLSESGTVAGYTNGTTYSCVVNGAAAVSTNSVTLANGDSATCTIANDDQAPSLTLVKNVVSNNGGTAAASAWTLSAAGPTPISGAGGASSGATFSAGTYTLSESGTVAGYTNGTTYSCVVNGAAAVSTNSVTLANGDSATCTITNDDQAPSLTLVKNVVSNNGGTAAASAWTLSAAGPTPISGAGGASSGATFSAGTYTLSESGTVAGYTNGTTYSCVVNGAAAVSTNSVTLANGDSATCTIANDDQAPSLTLVKNVVSNNGGTAAASAWTLSAAGPTPISGAGGASSGATFSAGTYTLSESGTVAGYTNGTTYSCVVNGAAAVSTNSVTLANGDSATCTIANDDQAPSLTLVKNVVSNNGGTAAASAWTLSAAGPTPISGAGGASSGATFSAGTYTLSESGTVAGYTNGTTYSCVVNGAAAVSTNSVTLANGDSATCTITNDDQAPSLTLVKNVVSNNGGTAAASAWTLSAAGPTPISGAGGASSGATFSAGTYTLSESGTVAGYTNGTTYSCVVNGAAPVSTNSVTLANGDSATCTITNDDQAPSLTLVKNVVSNNGGTAAASAWTLSAAGPTPISGAGGASSGATFSAGTYTLSESGTVAGYTNGTTYSCVVNGAAPVSTNSVTLANGDSATCTITNDDVAPTLTLNKILVLNDGRTATESNWTLKADGAVTDLEGPGKAGNADVVSGADFMAGVYTLSETGPGGFTASAWSCTNGVTVSAGNQITLNPGQSTVCSITNDDLPFSLVTSSSLCTFDTNTSLAGNQFRLLFTPDHQAPGYKQNATNPGQYYYNVFYSGTAGDTVTLTMTIPYPFVTQGANPVHLYDGATLQTSNGSQCITPANGAPITSIVGAPFGLDAYGVLPHDVTDFGETQLVVVTFTIPATGTAYLNIHLDYGLKGTTGYAKDANNNAVSNVLPNPMLIPDGQDYPFLVSDGVATWDPIVESQNEFKKNPGIGGLVATVLKEADGQYLKWEPIGANTVVEIYNSANQKVGSVTTDVDGYYMWSFKQTGKAQTYTVKVRAPGNPTQTVTIKANGFGYVQFELP